VCLWYVWCECSVCSVCGVVCVWHVSVCSMWCLHVICLVFACDLFVCGV